MTTTSIDRLPGRSRYAAALEYIKAQDGLRAAVHAGTATPEHLRRVADAARALDAAAHTRPRTPGAGHE